LVNRKSYVPFMFLGPGMVFLGIFLFYPTIRLFILSFHKYDMITPMEYVGLQNYQMIVSDPKFHQAFLNSWIYLLVTPILIVISFLVAILVNRKLPGISLFRAIYYLPVVTSMVVVGIAWRWMYQQQGLLNMVLKAVNFPGAPFGFLTSTSLSLPSVMWVTIWKGIGYYMVIFLAGLQAIPEQLYEAGRVDGANFWQLHLHVTLPQIRPQVVLVFILSSINALKVFTEVFVMTKGGPLDSSLTMVVYIYRQAFDFFKFGYASALGVIIFLSILIFSIFNMRRSRGGQAIR